MRLNQTVKTHTLEIVNFIAGAVVLTFELTAARIVAPYTGASTYIWTSIIGVILAALALGYAWGGRFADRRHQQLDIAFLLFASALLILLVNFFKDPLLSSLTDNGLSLQIQALLASIALFAAPTFLLGAISPYLARLSITEVKTSGQRLSRISAWGTAGSLFGTFLTGYVLFGFVSTKHILGWLATVLIVSGLALSGRHFSKIAVLLLVMTTINLVAPPPLEVSGIHRDLDTAYSRVLIRDVQSTRPVRLLQMDNRFSQSGIYKDGDPSLVFPYTRAFAEVAGLNPQASDYLIIGGGAFTFPAHLAHAQPSASIDVVEIDPGLIPISEEYFSFRRPDNLHITVADGRQYLNKNTKQYDVVYIDAFTSIVPPFQLLTLEANERIKEALGPNGLVVANIISATEGVDARLAESAVATYKQLFKYVTLHYLSASPNTSQRQNLILLASDIPAEDRLVAGEIPTSLQQLLDRTAVMPEGAGLVLTDDFAPVERFSANGV